MSKKPPTWVFIILHPTVFVGCNYLSLPLTHASGTQVLNCIKYIPRNMHRITGYFMNVSGQWETTLHCNVISHWLGAYTKWSLESCFIVLWWGLVMISFAHILQGWLSRTGANIRFPQCQGEGGNSPVPGEFHAQRPVTRSFDVFFDLHLNKQFSKQWWGWWYVTPSCP